MKFTIPRTTLQKSIKLLNKMISNINPMILVEASDGHVALSTTDFTTNVKITHQADVLASGSTVFATKEAFDIISRFDGDDVTFDGEKISCGRTSVTLPTTDRGDFPECPKCERQHMNIQSDIMTDAFNATTFIPKADISFNLEQKRLLIAAMDNYRIACYDEATTLDADIQARIPHETAKYMIEALKSIEHKRPAPINIAVDETHAWFTFDKHEIVIRLSDKKFPNYKSLMEFDGPEYAVDARLPKKSLLRALQIAEGPHYETAWTFQPDELILEAYKDKTNLKETIPLLSRADINVEVKINGEYVYEYVKTVDDKSIVTIKVEMAKIELVERRPNTLRRIEFANNDKRKYILISLRS